MLRLGDDAPGKEPKGPKPQLMVGDETTDEEKRHPGVLVFVQAVYKNKGSTP
ncbi:hypothetical protein STEG23_008816, partial [Scotinomys teguina]